MTPTIKFRAAVTALSVVGALILFLSLHGRHRPPEDHDILPTVPVENAPLTRDPKL